MKLCNERDDIFKRLKLEKLDTGFFNLYLTSYALITENTVIEDLLAQKQAVAYVIGKSRLVTSKNVLFINNAVISVTDVSTLNFSNAEEASIADTVFVGNR